MKKIKLKKWQLLHEDDISPSTWFPLFKHAVKLPNGKVIDDYYLSKMGDVAMILAITNDKKIVFVRQYKHGAGDIILELPAGRIEKSEKAIDVAKRELEEETGYHADTFEELGSIFPEPSKDTYKTFGFLTTNTHLQKSQKLDETEDIEIVLIPINEVNEKIKNGEICASDTIAFIKIAQVKYPSIFP